MKIIDNQTIQNLNISPGECVDMVKEAFLLKYDSILPPKTSISLGDNIFFNTMPCYLPHPHNRFGVKEVFRFPKHSPSLGSEIFLYNAENGELLSVMDGDWVTAMRTGAVAALAINTFRRSGTLQYAFMGLGNTARATLLCLLESNGKDEVFNIKLLSYKTQHESFMDRFSKYKNVNFSVVDNPEDLVKDSDVVVSCITAADSIIVGDEYFKEGVTVVPVHTRGFQNCDLFFDKVFVDDIGHVKGFKYYDKFKHLRELSQVLMKKEAGRESDKERILCYNIGIALHDIYFASRIYEAAGVAEDVKMTKITSKFWV